MGAHLQALVHEALATELPEISASHIADWGIPCGLQGTDGQVIYEWVEMAAGYLFAARQDGEGDSYWKKRIRTLRFSFSFSVSTIAFSMRRSFRHCFLPMIRRSVSRGRF